MAALDEASLSRFHLRAVLVSGMGFFTDAYDLFCDRDRLHADRQGVAPEFGQARAAQQHDAGGCVPRARSCSGASPMWPGASACTGWWRSIMVAGGALGSALSPSFWVLIAFRFLLGFGVGGDYPVSAVLISEYANSPTRRLVGVEFSTQALGLIVGPLIALGLLGAGTSTDLTWRLLLGLGAARRRGRYLRARCPSRQVPGPGTRPARRGLGGDPRADQRRAGGNARGGTAQRMALRAFLTHRRLLRILAGTAGCWFLLGLRVLREHDLHAADPRAHLAPRPRR